MNTTILGAGAWAFAIAQRYCENLNITLWGRSEDKIKQIISSKQHPSWHNHNIYLSSKIKLTSSFDLAIAKIDCIMLITPSNTIIEITEKLINFASVNYKNLTQKIPLILLSKGLLEINNKDNNNKAGDIILPTQFLQDKLSNWFNIYLLTGPSFALEVAKGLPCALTLASAKNFCNNSFNSNQQIDYLQQKLHCQDMRIYKSFDIIGCQIGGAFKNIIAIACGITHALGLGLNAQAALITRGLNEMLSLGQNLGAKAQTLYGLAGLGDLILTAGGELSRNRKFGEALVKINNINEAKHSIGYVVEGFYATRLFYKLWQEQKLNNIIVDMPILEAMYKILYENANILQIVQNLINRSPKTEE